VKDAPNPSPKPPSRGALKSVGLFGALSVGLLAIFTALPDLTNNIDIDLQGKLQEICMYITPAPVNEPISAPTGGMRQPVVVVPELHQSATLARTLHHVLDAFMAAGYVVKDFDTSMPLNSWDIMWSFNYPFLKNKDYFLSGEQGKLAPSQKINHFAGASWFTSKVELIRNWRLLDAVPPAFAMPADYDQFLKRAQEYPESMWVTKSAQHRGVRIISVKEATQVVEDAKAAGELVFLQEYIRDAYLVDGRRWDLGIYVAVTSFRPLKVYIYDDFLLRFCMKKYAGAGPNSDKDTYVIGDDYIPPWDLGNAIAHNFMRGVSAKNSLRAFIGEEKYAALTRNLRHNIVQLLRFYQPTVNSMTSKYPNGDANMFELWRFDFVVDSSMRSWLMEVNQSPNLSPAHTRGLYKLFSRVSADLLSLVGLTQLNHTLPTVSSGETFKRASEWTMRGHQLPPPVGEVIGAGDCNAVFPFCISTRGETGNCTAHPLCRACYSGCRTRADTDHIVLLHQEHYRRNGFRRIVPWPQEKLPANVPAVDTIIHEWIVLKCKDNPEWCLEYL